MKPSLAVLCGLHLIGDALILWLGYAWLSVPESNSAHLLVSLAMIAGFICSALWLHGTALVFFNRATQPGLRRAAGTALRHLPALILLAGIVVLLYALLDWANAHLGAPAFRLASWLTLTIRKPVSPARVLASFHAVVWLVRWWVLPAWLVPVAAAVALENWVGFGCLGQRHRISQFLKLFVLIAAGIWVPLKLLAWIPRMPNFGAEMASFVLRGGIAYLLFVLLLLALERIASEGMPSFNQRNNSAVP